MWGSNTNNIDNSILLLLNNTNTSNKQYELDEINNINETNEQKQQSSSKRVRSKSKLTDIEKIKENYYNNTVQKL